METNKTFDRASATVAEIAVNFPQAVDILNRYNLDYCCNGRKSFALVCQKANLNEEQIWNEIQEVKANYGADNRMRFDTWEPSLLIDFIVQHHHHYVRESIPRIQELLDKVCSVHGNDHPVLFQINNEFDDLAEELLNHLPKEEEILFPAIKRLTSQNTREPSPALTDLYAPISVLEHEHETAGKIVKTIRSLTDQYTLPAYACPTFELTYKMLQEFDKDLMQHIHLENNILFPKAKVRQS